MIEDWNQTKLLSISKLITKGTTPTTIGGNFSVKGINFIKSESLNYDGIIDTDRFVFIDEATNEKLKRSILEENDILFSIAGIYLGKTGVVKKEHLPANTNQACAIIRLKHSKADYRFIKQYFTDKSFIKYVNSLTGQAAQPNINLTDLGKLKLFLPPLPEQQRTASILSAYDDLIEVNNKRLTLLEQMAEQIYKEWFVRMRFPGYENTEFEKGIPKGWEVKPLSSIANILMGQSPKSEFYNEERIGLPFHQGVGNYGKRFPTHDFFCSVNGRQAKESDILFSVRAPVGRINIADKKMIIGRGLAAIRHKNNLQSYLFCLFNYYFQIEDVIGNGSIFNSVGKEELNKFKILQPSNNLDEKFDEIVNPIDVQIQNLFQQNQILKKTRDLLLPRLISGKLRVKDIKNGI